MPNLSFVAIIWIIFSRSPNVHLITAYLFIYFPSPDREPGIPYRYTGTNTRYRCTGTVPYRYNVPDYVRYTVGWYTSEPNRYATVPYTYLSFGPELGLFNCSR